MTRHLERVIWSPRDGVDLAAWPFTVPAVRAVIDAGALEIPDGVTFLVGENGSGKSTLVEAIAAIYPRHGVANPFVNTLGARRQEEDSPLRWHLRAETAQLASPAGFFLRSETMHDYLSEIDTSEHGRRTAFEGEALRERSHGEAVLTLLRHRFTEPGFYLLDEPEAALSFTSQLGLMAVLDELAATGSQVLAATHSPVLTALPGATILELDGDGLQPSRWEDLRLVEDHRTYLEAPDRFLRHLLRGR